MKKTRPKSYIAEDNSSLLYIINPKSTERGPSIEQEVVLVPRPVGSYLNSASLTYSKTESDASALVPSPDFVGFHPASPELVGIDLRLGHLGLVFFKLCILDPQFLFYSFPLILLLLHNLFCQKLLKFL